MKSIGVFVDVSNLYYCMAKKFNGGKLNYETYLTFIKDLGEPKKIIAYGAQLNDGAEGFIRRLKQFGYETKFKQPKTFQTETTTIKRKADWDVGIAMDIVQMIDRLDMIILGSADGDLEPVVTWAMSKGVEIIVVACGISKDLKETCTRWIEIPESFLEVVENENTDTATVS